MTLSLIFGIPSLIFFAFPLIVFAIAAGLYGRYNVSTGKHDQPINWFIACLFGIGALVLELLLSLAGNL